VTDLRLIVITDRKLAGTRSIFDIVREALAAGAPAIQLREKTAPAVQLLDDALRLRDLTRQHNALLFINDRADVALTAAADGVHVGPSDLPVAAVRDIAPQLLVGYSTDDPAVAIANVEAGAAYIGCGAVFGTSSKDVGAERIGVQGLQRVVRAVTAPVIAIGGITTANVGEVAAAGAAGCAVIGAVMQARQPGAAVEALLRAFG
jgi:thiamine-phosphate pyrophosphorylase